MAVPSPPRDRRGDRLRATGAAFLGVPAPALFGISGVSQYVGAAMAVHAFTLVPAAGVAWVRVCAGAVVLCAWRRPWRLRRPARDWLLAALLGLDLAAMNLSFYLAIDRLPLGTAVAIEFVGPVVVAAAGSRTRRDAGALALAVAGVALLSKVTLSGHPLGFALAVAAGVLWAGYIVLAHRVARRGLGTQGLAVGMAVGAVAIAPPAAVAGLGGLRNPAALALCAGAGMLSTVVPYALDQPIMRRLRRSAYALLLSLLPVTATVVGVVGLGQLPTPLEAAGIVLVVAAVAARSRQDA